VVVALLVAQEEVAVPQTAHSVDIVGSFAHFVRTALDFVGTVAAVVELAVPIVDIALLPLDLAAPTVETMVAQVAVAIVDTAPATVGCACGSLGSLGSLGYGG
jgi:hypothetical protein